MLLILLTFLAAFSIEALGTVISVIGLAAFLGSDPIIIALAIALDAGKLLSVTILYKWWKNLNFVMRTYMVIAVIITMSITSAGAFGYLSASFQKTIIPTKAGLVEVDALKKEQIQLNIRKTELSKRKAEIDKQIADLPSNFVRGRQKLINEFKEESKLVLIEANDISKRVLDIDRLIADKEVKNIDTQAHAGPIIFLSEAFNIPLEQAVKYIILMIIFVFDPLSVVLIISGNFLIDKYRERKDTQIKEEKKINTSQQKIIEDEIIPTGLEMTEPMPLITTDKELDKIFGDNQQIKTEEQIVIEEPKVQMDSHDENIPKQEEFVNSKSLEGIDHRNADVKIANTWQPSKYNKSLNLYKDSVS